MTAEVAILNKSGVALAADSAVTIPGGANVKIFNTVNKLFMLSKRAPIGAMVYGNAEFMGIPWETLVKLYRSHLGSRRFATLDGYMDDLLDFLTGANSPIGEDVQRAYMRQRTFLRFAGIRERITDEIERLLEERGQLSETHISGSPVGTSVSSTSSGTQLSGSTPCPTVSSVVSATNSGVMSERYGS